MDDPISRQAAIDALKVCVTIGRCNGKSVAFEIANDYADFVRKRIEALPSAQQEQRWIPCSERLPEEPFECLVTVWDTNLVTMDEFENVLPYVVGWDGKQWNDGDGEQCPFEVIAWMPLPAPYRPEGEEHERA